MFGGFSYIQAIVTFNELLKFLNRIKPTSVLTGTSLQSMSHQLIHSLAVYGLSHTVSRTKQLDKFLVFLVVLGSIVFTNFCAWSLNRMLKSRGINLDTPE